ncbi:MAG: MBL fold metallo-hydrolase [Patescibacteria group bacterium]
MRLSFHGGAGEVTGACYLLETAQAKILVDCGMFQGCAECGDLNFEQFHFNPKQIDAVFITHAHIDHVGRLPKLARDGFAGAIYSTPPTRDIASLLLDDAAGLAAREREMLWTAGDLERTLPLWRCLSYGEKATIGDVQMTLHAAGHILGSSMIEIVAEGKRLLFTGDLGNAPSTLLPPADAYTGADYMIIESTYGNRRHEPPEEREMRVERAMEDIAARGGTLMIPAFATERTQDLLFLLNTMLQFRRVPAMPVFVDAPLAIRITKVFEEYTAYYKEDVQRLFGEHPRLFQFKNLRLTSTVEESKAINDVPAPKVIIAGSGMMNGGRILHHLKRYLPDAGSILLIAGYQAAGSLGRRLIDGAREVKVLGEEISVRAEIRKVGGFSAHADGPQLFSFVSANRETLRRVFAVQGEQASAQHLAQEIRDRLGTDAVVPQLYQEFEI